MTATERRRVKPRIYRLGKCSGPHQFPVPLARQRPVVVFCIQCQVAKDIR